MCVVRYTPPEGRGCLPTASLQASRARPARVARGSFRNVHTIRSCTHVGRGHEQLRLRCEHPSCEHTAVLRTVRCLLQPSYRKRVGLRTAS
eukprot:6967036-Alexandrium_andersonii.AAC.1